MIESEPKNNSDIKATETSYNIATNEELDDLEWEEWDPSQISFLNHIIAGSFAGWAEHVALYPIDTLKTHVQYGKHRSPIESWKIVGRLLKQDGFIRLWRGVSATFAGCMPAHAAYFSVFEFSKKALGADTTGHTPVRAALTGGAAAISHDLFMTPFDVIKQRMQLGYYKSLSHCLRCVVRAEGISGLYISLPATLMMNIPYGLTLVPVNESMRKYLNPSGGYNFGATMTSGCVAGAVAAAITNPLDVIKTRLQTQNLNCLEMNSVPNHVFSSGIRYTDVGLYSGGKIPNSAGPMLHHTSAEPVTKILRRITGLHGGYKEGSRLRNFPSVAFKFTLSDGMTRTPEVADKTCNSCGSSNPLSQFGRKPLQGMAATARTILIEEGSLGFFKGILPRMLVHAPSAAISWTTYESMKSLLVA